MGDRSLRPVLTARSPSKRLVPQVGLRGRVIPSALSCSGPYGPRGVRSHTATAGRVTDIAVRAARQPPTLLRSELLVSEPDISYTVHELFRHVAPPPSYRTHDRSWVSITRNRAPSGGVFIAQRVYGHMLLNRPTSTIVTGTAAPCHCASRLYILLP